MVIKAIKLKLNILTKNDLLNNSFKTLSKSEIAD